MKISRLKWISPILILVLFAFSGALVDGAKKSGGAATAPSKAPVSAEDTSIIEEVTTKQLERLLHDKDYVAVYWCKLLRGF